MSSTNVLERNDQLLAIGAQCSHDSCNLIDFLPFTCGHCKQSFCQEHFKVEDHRCKHYDESKHNRIAPNCPLCGTPVAIPPGQNPNIRMEAHLRNDCSVMTGRAAKKSGPVCARAKCGKSLFSPIACDQCKQQFCPSHRFPGDHSCKTTPSRATPRATGATLSGSAQNLKTKTADALGSKAKAAKSAVGGTIQKGVAVTKAVNVPSGSANLDIKMPYSKQDRSVRSSSSPTITPLNLDPTPSQSTTCKPITNPTVSSHNNGYTPPRLFAL